jgi:hydroxylamine oxidation protein HaoB
MRLFRILGAPLLLIGGSVLLISGVLELTKQPDSHFNYHTVSELSLGVSGFPEIESHFPIQKVNRVSVTYMDKRQMVVDVAHYQDSVGNSRQALIFLPSGLTQKLPIFSDLNQLRWQAWLDASHSISDVSTDSTVITWWDNAQRIHLLNGNNTWVNAPVSEAFEHQQQDFWKHVSGGFQKRSEPSQQLANWLLMDAEMALEDIKKIIQIPHALYFLVCIDDLARLSEMRALSGKTLPFETRVFRSDNNIHSLISSVKRWAREKGNGSYLVQHLTGLSVRVWRITTAEGEKTLLARLLPFTSSLEKPLQNLELIHRSEWSGFVSIYQLPVSKSEEAEI